MKIDKIFSIKFDNDDFGYYQITVEQPEYDEKGEQVIDRKGNLKPDSKKRSKENIDLKHDIEEYFAKEVLPHVPNAWIDYDKTRIGYEINFTKYFFEFKGLRPSEEVKNEVVILDKEITTLLNDLFA